MMKNLLVTVCGRAGSKGFRNKNLKMFCGQPMVYYTLSAVELFCRSCPQYAVDVCLNTDSDGLAQLVAQRYPEVTFLPRSAELAGDTVPKEAVYQDCLVRMEKKTGKRYDCLIDLDITSPLRQDFDLVRAVEMFEAEPGLDLVLSAAPSRRNPYFNMGRLDGQGYACRVIENSNTTRQQAPACYDINASLYVFSRAFLLGQGAQDLWKGKIKIYEMFDTGILDIDCEEDYLLLEIIARYLYRTMPGFGAVQKGIRP